MYQVYWLDPNYTDYVWQQGQSFDGDWDGDTYAVENAERLVASRQTRCAVVKNDYGRVVRVVRRTGSPYWG